MERQRGFTIVELIITLVIAGVLVSLAAPNLSEFMKNSARTALLNDMVTAINYARSQAVSRNQRVSLCETDLSKFAAGAVPNACNNDDDTDERNHYESGWLVFVDDGPTPGTIEAGSGETVLRVFEPSVAADVRFEGLSGPTGSTAVPFVSFLGTGLADALGANTHFRYCDSRGDRAARAVRLTGSGQPRLTWDSDGDGIENLLPATELSCPAS